MATVRGMTTVTAAAEQTGDEASSGEPNDRIITPRRVWPGSRATVGGLLVAVAAIGLFAAFQQAGSAPSTLYLVTTEAVAPGTVLTSDQLGAQRMDLPTQLAARAFTLDDEQLVVGAVTTQAIGSGELLQVSDLRDGAGQSSLARFELSFRVSTDRAVGGSLRPGERIKVLATVGTGPSAVTTIVLDEILILEITRSDEPGLSAKDQVVTVALDTEAMALSLTGAVDKGTLTIVRSNGG